MRANLTALVCVTVYYAVCYNLVLTFKAADDIPGCDHLNESNILLASNFVGVEFAKFCTR